jgi:hypothetical protein
MNNGKVRLRDKQTYVWREWQPSWCPRTRTRGRPQQPPGAPSQQRIGSASQSAQQTRVMSTAPTQRGSNSGNGTYLEVLCNLTDETLEREFTDEELRRFLIPTNLSQSDGTRAEPVRLLNATSCSLKGQNQQSARDHNSDDDDYIVVGGATLIHTAAAVLRAALVASCLRGALPKI